MLNPRAQCLGAGFLSGKPRGKALCRVLLALAVSNLSGRKYLAQKTLPIARNRLGNPLYFHNVDPCTNQHEQNLSSQHGSTGGYESIPKSCEVTMKIGPLRSDHVGVIDADELVDWDLRLTATCADDPQRVMRFLTGAVLSCGGWVLSRSMPGSDTVEMSFEFARAVSLEVYSVLIAAGLELSRDAHISMTELYQCTKNLLATKGFDVARVRLLVLAAPIDTNSRKNTHHPVELT